MAIVDRIAGALGYEKRTASSDPYLAERRFGFADNTAGQFVTASTATRVAAVHACVQLIAETTASLPLSPYRRSEDGSRVPDSNHPLHRVLHNRANRVQTAYEFREQFVASCLLTGNGYAVKVMNGQGEVTELLPLRPEDVLPVRLENGRVRYEVREGNRTAVYTQDEILHLRYRSDDGFTGISPIAEARDTIGIAIAQQQYEGGFFKKGASPSGIITFPASLTEEQRQRVRQSWADKHAGVSNMHQLVVAEEGTEFKPMTMTQRDAEYIETRRLTLDDIARIYRVPPPMIGILRDATYSNITEQSRMLVSHCLRPWFVRIEQAMNESLLTDAGRQTHFIEHNAEGLLRGDTKSRYEAYRIGREWGWLSPNDIRARENMGSLGADGDSYREPLNTAPLGEGNDET